MPKEIIKYPKVVPVKWKKPIRLSVESKFSQCSWECAADAAFNQGLPKKMSHLHALIHLAHMSFVATLIHSGELAFKDVITVNVPAKKKRAIK